MTRAFATSAIGLCALLTLAACSVERSLDGDSLAAQVQGQLFAEHPGLVAAVECPSPADPDAGDVLACAVQLGEQIVDVQVTLVGTDDALRAQAVLDDRFVEASQLAALLAEQFGAEIGIATIVDCGQPVVVLDADDAIICTATDPTGVSRQFDVTVADDGSVDFEIR